mmetsp:Transcript_6653/g.14739  ORF Transcript_6653/g.14739 Transcript_6653/m.14739 type:complete len:216 (+) Transcript_6653:404-1051(+)
MQRSHQQRLFRLAASAIVGVDLALASNRDDFGGSVHHVDERGDSRLPEREAVCWPVPSHQPAHLAERRRREDLLGRRPHDLPVIERLSIVVVDLEVQIDKRGVRELLLERGELVRGDLLLLGERHDRELEPCLLQHGEHAFHLMHVAEPVGAAGHENRVALRLELLVPGQLGGRVHVQPHHQGHQREKQSREEVGQHGEAVERAEINSNGVFIHG